MFISSPFPTSHIALIASSPAAGAINTAIIPAMLLRNGPITCRFPNQGDVAPIPIRSRAAIKNVGILSFVMVPTAKKDSTPTMNPRTASVMAT